MAELSRRDFIQTGAVAVSAALASPRARGANERIRFGVIGTANRGGQDMEAALAQSDAEIAALCDVDREALEKKAAELGGKPDLYKDYRELLDRKDIDAVIIATPDHWHALQAIHACEAGKDVYVEKPLTQTIVEGRKMIEAARRTNRVVQVGLQRRSSALYHELHDYIAAGNAGKISVGRACRISNMWPKGIGKAPAGDPPATLDWNLWLGPREERAFQSTIAPYRFRWWQHYSSQVGNWGVHYFDLIRWMLDETAPVSVCAMGGQFAVDDDRTIPDTMEVVFEFASGRLLTFSQYEANSYKMFPFGDVELRGTKGTIHADYSRFQVTPCAGGQFQDDAPRMEPYARDTGEDDPTNAHMRNFMDCVRSRQRPNCDVEDGHLSTVFAHLANISLATRQRLEWDAAAERFTNSDEANKQLHYEYREPWKLT